MNNMAAAPATISEQGQTYDVATSRHVVAASLLAWLLDACDFFIVLFTLDDVARSFHASLETVLLAPTLTLLTRPIGAFLCGYAADRYGRKPVMITTIVVYSAIEILSAFAPSLMVFLLLRALFGIALGGEWGVGTSLIMESIPPSWRGTASGLLQAGYPGGYLLASLVFLLLPFVGWRGLFILGGNACWQPSISGCACLKVRVATPPAYGRYCDHQGSGPVVHCAQ